MKRFSEFILEKLLPSQYRKFVKGWNKKVYEDIFKNSKYEHDKNGYRIFIPFDIKQEKITPNKKVANYLDKNGYEIVDYIKGLAKRKDNSRLIRIGKLIDDHEIKKIYDNDPARQAQDEYEIVISRHPYDLAGMSTDRGWTSCMNLNACPSSENDEDDDFDKNKYYNFKEGQIIAYLVKKGDRNINKPLSRVLIKPYININNPSDVYLGLSNVVYGIDKKGFRSTVKKWIDEINKSKKLRGLFILDPKLYKEYADSGIVVRGTEAKKLYSNPESIKNIENPTSQQQLYALYADPSVIKYIKNLDMAVLDKVVIKHPEVIRYMDNPSERIQLAAIKSNPFIIQYIKNPSEKVQLEAVKGDPHTIRYIKNPSEKVQLEAVKRDGFVVKYIKNPSEDIEIVAARNFPEIIDYVHNLSKKARLAAIETDPSVIELIKNPTPEEKKIS